ncbi:MAG TPA: GTPase [Planctomycetaceae bacterium]|nr:GTPase [Planctomycetaceae bacterium]
MAEPIGSVAVLTPVGRGAVATVRWCGPADVLDEAARGLFRAASGQSLTAQPLHRIVFGQWGTVAAENVVVCRTAEEELEVHCHGGVAAVRLIVGDLVAAGGREVSWQVQQSQRTSGLEAELQMALSRTSTRRTVEFLLEQLTGGLLASARGWRRLSRGDDERRQAAEAIAEMLRWECFGRHLAEPWRIVLTGRPNVGKSSLINALLGYQRAIVFDQPGTTRDVVTGETAFEGWPVVLADTAGLRETDEQLEAVGVARAREAVAGADLVLVLIDVSQPATPADLELLAGHPDAVIVAHKSDLPDRWGEFRPAGALPVSSVTGEGVQELQRRLMVRLIPQTPQPGAAIPVTGRQVRLLTAMLTALRQPTADAWLAALEAFWSGGEFA